MEGKKIFNTKHFSWKIIDYRHSINFEQHSKSVKHVRVSISKNHIFQKIHLSQKSALSDPQHSFSKLPDISTTRRHLHLLKLDLQTLHPIWSSTIHGFVPTSRDLKKPSMWSIMQHHVFLFLLDCKKKFTSKILSK